MIPDPSSKAHYNRLKDNYGKQLAASWDEVTDPQKFVYEDVAIAAYLLCHFKKGDTFVDLGCGNGLLVYLLNQEGFNGFGVDIRRRKIWDRFDKGHTGCFFIDTDYF